MLRVSYGVLLDPDDILSSPNEHSGEFEKSEDLAVMFHLSDARCGMSSLIRFRRLYQLTSIFNQSPKKMNFGAHQQRLVERLGLALGKDKSGLIKDFQSILSDAKGLFKTNSFDFWLSQLGQHEFSEIPITKYGHALALNQYQAFSGADRNAVCSGISHLCELLFTYSNDREMCELQSDFHYYVNEENGLVYRESEMGHIEPEHAVPKDHLYRIALMSEVDAPASEYYG